MHHSDATFLFIVAQGFSQMAPTKLPNMTYRQYGSRAVGRLSLGEEIRYVYVCICIHI